MVEGSQNGGRVIADSISTTDNFPSATHRTIYLSAAVARRLPIICLLGHPWYYPRFGFEPARPLGIEPEVPTWPDDAWMVLRLPDWTPDLRGVAHFPPAFADA